MPDRSGHRRPAALHPTRLHRLFITDAIMGGLPPHIAQVIRTSTSPSTTRRSTPKKRTWPTEPSSLAADPCGPARNTAFHRRGVAGVPRPLRRRKVSIGASGRVGIPCIHEHACATCPMLWPDPNQRMRLVEIRDGLQARIAPNAKDRRIEGLQVSLARGGGETRPPSHEPQRRRHRHPLERNSGPICAQSVIPACGVARRRDRLLVGAIDQHDSHARWSRSTCCQRLISTIRGCSRCYVRSVKVDRELSG